MKPPIDRAMLPLALTLLALFALPAAGQSAPKPSDKDLADITTRGTLLFGYDQSAWHASDAVEATHPVDAKIQRYIARKTPTGWVVDFGRLSADSTQFLVAYQATQAGAPSHYDVTALDPERADSGFDLAAAKAIDLALKDFGNVTRSYNVAALPSGPDGIFVYVYPAQTKAGDYPYGGDTRYLVSPDGATIVSKRQLHKTVLDSIPAEVPKGTTTASGYHTHILTSLPEDTDILLVLTRKPSMPEYVEAGGHLFLVANDGAVKIVK